ARLLLVCGDEILGVKGWLGVGKWVLPGGGIQRGEDIQSGLLREVYEETGIQLKSGQVRALKSEKYSIHGFSYLCHYFVAEVAAKPPHRRRPFEIVDIGWSNKRQVTSKTHNPDVIRALLLLDSQKPL
ncbi:MAG: hydrolase, partial [Marmoricola sp.]|nr:hydrolase [Marmoricola sp.]